MNDPIHGTRSRYRKGCRCDDCRTAEREYRRRYRAEVLELQTRRSLR